MRPVSSVSVRPPITRSTTTLPVGAGTCGAATAGAAAGLDLPPVLAAAAGLAAAGLRVVLGLLAGAGESSAFFLLAMRFGLVRSLRFASFTAFSAIARRTVPPPRGAGNAWRVGRAGPAAPVSGRMAASRRKWQRPPLLGGPRCGWTPTKGRDPDGAASLREAAAWSDRASGRSGAARASRAAREGPAHLAVSVTCAGPASGRAPRTWPRRRGAGTSRACCAG